MGAEYLDRLARTQRLDNWATEDLVGALATIEEIVNERWQQREGRARVLNIRLQIYRFRVQRELDLRGKHRRQAPS
ncbi:hypothetical protein [Kribbella sp. NPDC004875]|uniref:hypothetical protein n=1 Tax=Kribbella sp. NPDC004875 TaxID=3364107 RepID=UPI0036BEFA5B